MPTSIFPKIIPDYPAAKKQEKALIMEFDSKILSWYFLSPCACSTKYKIINVKGKSLNTEN